MPKLAVSPAVAVAGNPVDPSGERFRLVFEGSALGIALIGSDGRSLHVNPALQHMLGYAEAEFARVPFQDLTHPDDRPRYVERFSRLVAGDIARYKVDQRYLHKDGRLVWVRLTVSAVPDPEGGFGHAIVMVEDVTVARDAHEHQAELLEALAERVKELTALHETARILQNERLTPREILMQVAPLLPTAFQYPLITAARITYGTIDIRTPGYASGPWRLSASFATRDGRSGEVAVVYLEDRPLEDEGPFMLEERKLLESVADILEVALERRNAQERLTVAVASTGVGVWEWDVTTDRMQWSEQMERIAGLAPGTFPGTLAAFKQRVHHDDEPHVMLALERALDEAPPNDRYNCEYRMAQPDGGYRWVLARGQVFRDAEGIALRVIGTSTDVSERHRLEDELRHSQKMDAIGRLAGGVAHDFNNLLTIIAVNCDFLLADLREDPNSLERLAEIRDATERAASLTRQLSSFSRKNLLQPNAVDPALFLHRLEPLLRRIVGDSVHLSSDVDDDVGLIRVDVGHLEQVVMNMVVNARDAMSNCGTLTIGVSNIDLDETLLAGPAEIMPGPYVAFRVTDTGMGMNLETRARIFEPFFTTKGPGQGTGLGLSTVFGIVRQSGGHITVESELGRGSTFTICLPRVIDDGAAESRIAPIVR